MVRKKKLKVCFGVSDTGLGHATRSLPLIKGILSKGHKVYVLSGGRSLNYLKNELGDQIEAYIEQEGLPLSQLYEQNGFDVSKVAKKLPNLIYDSMKEHSDFLKVDKKFGFDVIISDSRLGIYNRKKPSYFIVHHIRMPLIRNNDSSKLISEFVIFAAIMNFKKILIPDFEKHGMAGDYTHNFKFLKDSFISYLGVLSTLKKKKTKDKVNVFFSVSGPEPQRTVLEKKVLNSLKYLKNGSVVVTLGKPELNSVKKIGNATIYSHMGRKQQELTMNSADVVVTRAGYTTLMELFELGKKALIIPTKNQPEHEYLAKYHSKMKNFHAVSLDKLDLIKDLEKAKKLSPKKIPYKTNKSVKIFLKEVNLD